MPTILEKRYKCDPVNCGYIGYKHICPYCGQPTSPANQFGGYYPNAKGGHVRKVGVIRDGRYVRLDKTDTSDGNS